MAVIIKRRGVEYWSEYYRPGSDPNPFRNQPEFPTVTVVDRTTRTDVARHYLLLAIEENRIGIPSRLVATPTHGTRWRRPYGGGSTEVEAWDVRGNPAYISGLSSDALPPPGQPLSYVIEGLIGPGVLVLATAAAAGSTVGRAQRAIRKILRRDSPEALMEHGGAAQRRT